MDSLQEVIHSFNVDQQKEFIYFIQRNKYRKGRKDLQLFNLLKQEKEYSTTYLVSQLKTTNHNAYHTIRKRLFSHLADYVVLQSTSGDASTSSHVNAIIGVVNYLFDKALIKQAWKYLFLAEKIAMENEFRDVLNTIYLLQIEKCHLNSDIDIYSIVMKYEQNHEALQLNEKLQIASGLIRNKLIQEKKKGIDINFSDIVQNALQSLKLDERVLNTPKISLDFVKIIRAGIIAKKDFYNFEPFILKAYLKHYKNQKQESNPMVKSEFLYLLSHALYRNKKFSDSLHYVEQMEIALKDCSKAHQKQQLARCSQLKAANLMFLNQLPEALNCLNLLLKNDSQLSLEEKSNTLVNLGIYHYLKKDYKKANQLLLQLNHSDSWYKKTMGAEWLFKKYLMEILLFIDLKHIDVAESRIRTTERSFKNFKTNPVYERAFGFLDLIKIYLESNSKKLLNEAIEKQVVFIPFEYEDLQAMTFFAWLRAKAKGEDFYSTLLGVTNREK
ncbi:MAG: hypothetical protein NT150_02460 [Bacteroidetes bacterium]|nr:hypothetical protein [Bacteroidota bacterium]